MPLYPCLNILNINTFTTKVFFLIKLLEDIVDNQESNWNLDLEVGNYHRIGEISNIEIE